MYYCINCGNQMEELYRRYCPSVLKLLDCDKCGSLADKYIEYDPAIVLVDLILTQKQAYRHLLYNSKLKSYWKLLIVLCFAESFRIYSLCSEVSTDSTDIENNYRQSDFDSHCNFYWILIRTTFSVFIFLATVVSITETKWALSKQQKPNGYSIQNLMKALVIGSSGKLLGFLGIVWRMISFGPHYILIQGYTYLCLITAYSVVCNSGKFSSSIVLAIALIAYACSLPRLNNDF